MTRFAFRDESIQLGNTQIDKANLQSLFVRRSSLHRRSLLVFVALGCLVLVGLEALVEFRIEWVEQAWLVFAAILSMICFAPIAINLFVVPKLSQYTVHIATDQEEWEIRSSRRSHVLSLVQACRSADVRIEENADISSKRCIGLKDEAIEQFDFEIIHVTRFSYALASNLCLTNIALILSLTFVLEVLSYGTMTILLGLALLELLIVEYGIRYFNGAVATAEWILETRRNRSFSSNSKDLSQRLSIVHKSRISAYGLIPRYKLRIANKPVSVYDIFIEPRFIESFVCGVNRPEARGEGVEAGL